MRSGPKHLSVPALALVALVWAVPAAAQAAPAALEKLALADLVRRPDRWPASIKLKRAFAFSGGSVPAGKEVKVLEFDGAQVLVDGGNELYFEVAPDDCDLLDAANVAWAALTPAQRAVDVKTLLDDASLWPEKVVCAGGFQLEDGTLLPPGAEYELLSLDAQGVKVWSWKHKTTLVTELGQTDLVTRARQRVLLPAEQRGSRVATALKKTLVDIEGKPFTSPGIEQAKVYVLYFGASWCGPCRKFSPSLVRFVTSNLTDNPRMATVLLSNDEKDADMRAYMKDEKMPWPAMPLSALRETPLFLTQSAGVIPHLVVLDRHGKLLASSMENGQYDGPERALKKLQDLLATGIAK